MSVQTEIAEYLVSLGGVQVLILFMNSGIFIYLYAIYRKVVNNYARSDD